MLMSAAGTPVSRKRCKLINFPEVHQLVLRAMIQARVGWLARLLLGKSPEVQLLINSWYSEPTSRKTVSQNTVRTRAICFSFLGHARADRAGDSSY